MNRLDTRSFDLRKDGSLPSTAVTKYRRKGIGNAKGIVDLLTYDLGENKELRLKQLLLKHQCKMVDIHEKYKDIDFENSAVRDEFTYLHSKLINRFNY